MTTTPTFTGKTLCRVRGRSLGPALGKATGLAAVLALGSVALAGCGLVNDSRPSWAKEGPRPVDLPAAAANARADDGLYADAVSAIGQRDYATALDALQGARARDATDPRVWNAFGVVYDELGRFDLSGRYYAKAAALDPGSPIVANNRAYSHLIQSHAAPAEAEATVQLARSEAAPLSSRDWVVRPIPVAEKQAAAAAKSAHPQALASAGVHGAKSGPARPKHMNLVARLAAIFLPHDNGFARNPERMGFASAADARIDIGQSPRPNPLGGAGTFARAVHTSRHRAAPSHPTVLASAGAKPLSTGTRAQ